MKQDSGFFFRRLVNDVSDAMIAADPDMLIREWNKAAESLYGYSRAEAQGKLLVELVRREYIGITKKKPLSFFRKTENGTVKFTIIQVMAEDFGFR
ncbi:PAS domain-containing protein, partial [bacterium]|nr:PAS domain-containing protein [bacterium]